MDLFMAISQGIGSSLAAGVRPFLVTLFVGAMARADVGVDFDGTEYEFLESVFWLVLMLVLIVGAWLLDRSHIEVPEATWAVTAGALGGVLFAGSLAEQDYASAAGLLAGVAFALFAFLAARAFLGGASERLAARGESGATIQVLGDLAAIVLAALALLVSPVSYVALAFCAWVLLARRRRAGQKYEGLRILR
jgi:hypothetical protein